MPLVDASTCDYSSCQPFLIRRTVQEHQLSRQVSEMLGIIQLTKAFRQGDYTR